MTLPTHTKCIVLAPISSDKLKSGGPVYVPVLETRVLPVMREGDVLVRVQAAGFTRRELWQSRNLYPGTVTGEVIGVDGAGTVVAAFDREDPLLGRRVFFVPTTGWESDPMGPEDDLPIIGRATSRPFGTFSEFVVIERTQLIPVPAHLHNALAAAWPVAGVTAWRAIKIKAGVQKGHIILITGIGGGVAVTALQICVALGAEVFVTSGDRGKITRAVELGAKGGVVYNDKDWPAQLAKLLNGRMLDSVIDSAGGDICTRLNKVLRMGARVVCYGMTAIPKINFTMHEVLRNIELKGSTMGSRADLVEATTFIDEHRIIPIVSHVLQGLEGGINEGFSLLERGRQLGKIVIVFPEHDLAKL